MALLTNVVTVVVTALAGLGIWLLTGQDPEVFAGFLIGNWSTILLAVQMVVIFILAATQHIAASAFVLVTALMTVLGKVVV